MARFAGPRTIARAAQRRFPLGKTNAKASAAEVVVPEADVESTAAAPSTDIPSGETSATQPEAEQTSSSEFVQLRKALSILEVQVGELKNLDPTIRTAVNEGFITTILTNTTDDRWIPSGMSPFKKFSDTLKAALDQMQSASIATDDMAKLVNLIIAFINSVKLPTFPGVAWYSSERVTSEVAAYVDRTKVELQAKFERYQLAHPECLEESTNPWAEKSTGEIVAALKAAGKESEVSTLGTLTAHLTVQLTGASNVSAVRSTESAQLDQLILSTERTCSLLADMDTELTGKVTAAGESTERAAELLSNTQLMLGARRSMLTAIKGDSAKGTKAAFPELTPALEKELALEPSEAELWRQQHAEQTSNVTWAVNQAWSAGAAVASTVSALGNWLWSDTTAAEAPKAPTAAELTQRIETKLEQRVSALEDNEQRMQGEHDLSQAFQAGLKQVHGDVRVQQQQFTDFGNELRAAKTTGLGKDLKKLQLKSFMMHTMLASPLVKLASIITRKNDLRKAVHSVHLQTWQHAKEVEKQVQAGPDARGAHALSDSFASAFNSSAALDGHDKIMGKAAVDPVAKRLLRQNTQHRNELGGIKQSAARVRIGRVAA